MIDSNVIVRVVCRVFDVRRPVLLSPRRDEFIARPRQVAMYLMRTMLNRSYPQIGRFFVRDHTSALAAVRVIEKRLTFDDRLRTKVEQCRAMLGDNIIDDETKCLGCLHLEAKLRAVLENIEAARIAAGRAA